MNYDTLAWKPTKYMCFFDFRILLCLNGEKYREETTYFVKNAGCFGKIQ